MFSILMLSHLEPVCEGLLFLLLCLAMLHEVVHHLLHAVALSQHLLQLCSGSCTCQFESMFIALGVNLVVDIVFM